MSHPAPDRPVRAPRPSSDSSRLRVAILGTLALGSLALGATGCVGGASERAPGDDRALSKSQWVFPLYHYSRDEGRKTVRPLFLFPISYGGGGSSDSDEFARGPDDRLGGGDTPLWRDAPATTPSRADGVQPGIWGSSVPAGDPGAFAAAGAGGGREHEVRAGETLYAIARRYYGTGAEWPKIAEANRDRVPSPQALTIGTRLRIP